MLLGTDTGGHVFFEDTITVVLSRHGAGILSKHRLAPDDILTIRFRGGNAEAAVRLVGEMGRDARGFTYGVAFADPDLDFWELKFPPPPGWPGGVNVDLECSSCQTRDTVDQTEVEADVYTLAGYILRFCPRCGTSTEWRKSAASTGTPPTVVHAPAATSRPVASKPHADESVPMLDPEPLPSPSLSNSSYAAESAELAVIRSGRTSSAQVEVAPPVTGRQQALPPVATNVVACKANRRRDVRIRVSFIACIRQEACGEEIVECDNVSKGGLSFRSKKSYAVGSTIEVAIPFSPGTPPIFVLANIKHVESLNISSLFRYGAAYTPKASASQLSFER